MSEPIKLPGGETLPDEPVDGYTVEWWESSANFGGVWSRKAVYHVDTPFSEVEGGSDRGVPVVNQWLFYERGHITGRSHNNGWGRIAQIVDETDATTEAEALADLRAAYHRRIGSLTDQINWCVEQLREIK